MGEASGKLRFAQESENGQSLLLFFVKPAKNQQAIKIKCAQKHFKSALGHHTNYRKKTKLKIVKNEQFSFAKRNQGKQAFLGILACLLGSQYDVHFLAEFKSLKNEK